MSEAGINWTHQATTVLHHQRSDRKVLFAVLLLTVIRLDEQQLCIFYAPLLPNPAPAPPSNILQLSLLTC